MPRLVRRAPLGERIRAYLNPLDFLLWLSEEVDSNDWDEFHRSYSTPIGLVLNFVFLIARANGGRGRGSGNGMDDVFGDETSRGGSGWLGWLVRAFTFITLFRMNSVTDMIFSFIRPPSSSTLSRSSPFSTPCTPSVDDGITGCLKVPSTSPPQPRPRIESAWIARPSPPPRCDSCQA